MSLPDANKKQFRMEILTEHYLMQCTVEPPGMLMTYLDSPDRTNLLLKDITLTGVGTDSTVSSIKLKELYVQRSEVIAISLSEADLQGAVQKLPAHETLRIFMPRFIVQGTLTHGQDTRLGDMFEVMKGTWVSVSNAQVFPLTSVKVHPFRETPFLLLNKDRVRFYEPVLAN